MRTFNEYMIENLKNHEEARAYLKVVFEEYGKDNDYAALMLSFRFVIEAQGGITALAERTGLNRQNLYKILTSKSVLRFDTFTKLLKGLGFVITISI